MDRPRSSHDVQASSNIYGYDSELMILMGDLDYEGMKALGHNPSELEAGPSTRAASEDIPLNLQDTAPLQFHHKEAGASNSTSTKDISYNLQYPDPSTSVATRAMSHSPLNVTPSTISTSGASTSSTSGGMSFTLQDTTPLQFDHSEVHVSLANAQHLQLDQESEQQSYTDHHVPQTPFLHWGIEQASSWRGGLPRPRTRATSTRSLPRLSTVTSQPQQFFHSIAPEYYFSHTYRCGEGSRSLPIFKYNKEFSGEVRPSSADSHHDKKLNKSSPYARFGETRSSHVVPKDSLGSQTKIESTYERWTSPSTREEEWDSSSDVLKKISSKEHHSIICKENNSCVLSAVSSSTVNTNHQKLNFQQILERDRKEKKYYLSDDVHSLSDLCEKIPTATRRKTRDPKNWEFLMRLLADSRTNPWLIRWDNEVKSTFKLVQPDVIVKLWNSRSKKTHIIYEAFARGLRYHYRAGALFMVAEQQMAYGCGPKALKYYRDLLKRPQDEK